MGVRFLLILGLACSAGCGARPVSVGGKVTLDGKPAADVAVSFVPTNMERRKRGESGNAVTDEGGRFTLENFEGVANIFEGEYHVIFSKWITSNGKPLPKGVRPSDVSGAEQVIPGQYLNPRQTPFKVKVSPENAHFTFALEGKRSD